MRSRGEFNNEPQGPLKRYRRTFISRPGLVSDEARSTFVPFNWSAGTIGVRLLRPQYSICGKCGDGGSHLESAYLLWVGQPVVLQLASREFPLPLRGTIVGESEGTVRLRVSESVLDICKNRILAVEEDSWAGLVG